MKLSFIKSHGSGNDFLILDEAIHSKAWTDEERRELTLSVCNRETGIGADGVLFMSDSDQADAKMRVFNSDGSEASMCGNGLRVAGRYICEKLSRDSIRVETMKAVLAVERAESLSHDVPTYAVEISPVLFSTEALPLSIGQETLIEKPVPEWHSELLFTAVAVPNPHIITSVSADLLNSPFQKEIATTFNGENKWFSDGVNVSFVVELAPRQIYVRTFERGVGFTNACGTAMSSCSLVQVLKGQAKPGEVIDVFNDGGRVQCVVHQNEGTFNRIDLIGNATFTHEIALEWEDGRFDLVSSTETDEQQTYEKMAADAKARVAALEPAL